MKNVFSTAQNKAIMHKDGPAIIIAGPGSGKTLVITQRTLRLCEDEGVDPSKILVVTFTKAAAKQMKTRFQKLSGGLYSQVSFGTFHSVFFTILKNEYRYTSSNILTEDKRYELVMELLAGYKFDYDDEKEFVSGVLSEISLVKGGLINVEAYSSLLMSEDIFREIYKKYNRFLMESRLLDFDDMLIRCYHLLRTNERVLNFWRERFEYIMIDEFQDINTVQYLIMRMLARPLNNIFIVGDDDQSVYSFRGAKPAIMLNFEKDFPGCKKIVLDDNYRSGAKIIEAAKRLIDNNEHRFDKDIRAFRKEEGEISVREFATLSAQNDYMAKSIRAFNAQGISYSDMAVLIRTNSQAGVIADKLMEYNIPFSVKEGIPDIFDHFIAKDMMSYIKAAGQIVKSRDDSADRELLTRIINRPNRYISRDALLRSKVSKNDMCTFYKDREWMIERIELMYDHLKFISGLSPYAAICYIRNKVGYDDYIKDYAKERKIDEEELFAVMEELSESAKRFKTVEEWQNYRNEFKKKLSDQKNDECVSIMTFHGAKGLEFDTVFIADANEEITPHNKEKTPAGIEEERRMFYVAMTRAINRLYILSERERYNKELIPSRFVGEILTDKKKITAGSTIWHKTYGEGRILQREGNRIRVRFRLNAAEKVLNLDYCLSAGILTTQKPVKAESDYSRQYQKQPDYREKIKRHMSNLSFTERTENGIIKKYRRQ